MNRKLVLFLSAFAALMPMIAFAQDTGDGQSTPLDSLSTFALWGIVGGVIASVATAVINRSTWPSTIKLVVFFAVCCVVAAGNAYFNRTLDLADWSRSLLLVVAAGWTTYIAAKPAIVEIEQKTS